MISAVQTRFTILLVLFLSVRFLTLTASASARRPNCGDGYCICEGQKADCRYAGLTYVPAFPDERITELDMSFTNIGEHVGDADFFLNASSVTVLKMISCNLRAIPTFPAKVRNLDISFNNIRYINSSDFRPYSATLESLTMSNCQLNFPNIAPGAFDSLQRLTKLDLSYNYFQKLPESMFSPALRDRLVTFNFRNNNQMICDCHVMWFARWMGARPKVFTEDGSTRASVSDLSKFYTCWLSECAPSQLPIIELKRPPILDGSCRCQLNSSVYDCKIMPSEMDCPLTDEEKDHQCKWIPSEKLQVLSNEGRTLIMKERDPVTYEQEFQNGKGQVVGKSAKNSNKSSSEGGISAFAVVMLTIISIIAVFAVSFVVFLLCRKRSNKKISG